MRSTTLKLGLIGFPLDHSLSPYLHMSALKILGLNGDYKLFPAAPDPQGAKTIRNLFEQMRQGELHGLNITIPHKQTVIPYLDELTPTASAIGAVNTIVYKGGRLIGDNTDCPGFLADLVVQLGKVGLKELPDQTGKSALVLGGGGSARAIVFGLLQNSWQVAIAARRSEQAQELMKSLSSDHIFAGGMNILHHKAIQDLQLIVNTTPLGMHPNVKASPWPANLPFPHKVFIYDLIYNPPETVLMQSAKNCDLPSCNGLGMLVRQAALAFHVWTGLEPPWEAIYKSVATQV